MKILYFAWLRTKIGVAEEDITPPAEVGDVAALIDWLKGPGDGYAGALADPPGGPVARPQVLCPCA